MLSLSLCCASVSICALEAMKATGVKKDRQPAPPNQVFVGNIPHGWSEGWLKSEFAHYKVKPHKIVVRHRQPGEVDACLLAWRFFIKLLERFRR